MISKKSIGEVLDFFKENEWFNQNIVYWHTIEEKEAKTVPFPESMHPNLIEALKKREIQKLYIHQKEAYDIASRGENFVAVTPTASGKTLCYNLPVLEQILNDSHSRALYIFPTKALAQDQKSELNEIINTIGVKPIYSDTYDGDTSPSIRQKIRKIGHIVITNPDMLHSAILPHHTKWVSFFENLKFVVIDELHTYRGVFGSHVANVIRRLKRICHFYGSNPQFICTSATIANPKELAEHLTGTKMNLVNNNGAPRSKKHFLFYNPPIVNRALNIRKSATFEVSKLAKEFLKNDVQTIVFAKSRVRVEIILKYLQELTSKKIGNKTIQGYRGGYLPNQRRTIEKGLREGKIKGVVSTNALELGIDIGQLEACIMTGYPGSIASVYQQAGRAGRRKGEAAIILVASASPLDQYIMNHPEYVLNRNPETGIINPDNLIILVDHVKCAAFELPFQSGETFDGVDIQDVLEFLSEEQVLYYNQSKWFWMNDSFPAHNISLRSASQENIVIIDHSVPGNVQVIGEMDRFSAMTLLHEEAIYLHQGIQYQVEKLDWDEKKAFVREVEVDYFTDANLAVELKVLEVDQKKYNEHVSISYGDVMVLAKATIFKKIKFDTHENIGSGPIHLPEEELHTSASWISFEKNYISDFGIKQLEHILLAISHAIRYVASFKVMCDPVDLHVVPQIKSIHDQKPTIFLYDRYPGGIGLSKKIYEDMDQILIETSLLIENCKCADGCPSCIGTDGNDSSIKERTIQMLKKLSEAFSCH